MGNGEKESGLARLIQPKTFAEAMEMAKTLGSSDLMPKAFQGKPANILIAWEMGAEVGLSPFSALQSIAVINGKPSLYGEAPLGIVMSSGLLEKIVEEDDGETATCIVKRKGQEQITRTFSMAEARAAQMYERDGQGNGKWIALSERAVWKSWPKRMRQMRARSWALKDAFPDLLKGIGIAEELRDLGDVNAHTGEVIETEKVEENVYAPRQKAPEPPSAASPVQPPEPAGSDEPLTAPAGGSIPDEAGVASGSTQATETGASLAPSLFSQEAPTKPRVVKPRPKVAGETVERRPEVSSPAVAQDRESGQGATVPPVEPVQGVDAPPPAPAVASTTFEINGTEYTTRGLTREQLLASFKLVPQVDRKVGKGTSRTLLMKMFTLQSRTELTEQQGAEFLAALEKALT